MKGLYMNYTDLQTGDEHSASKSVLELLKAALCSEWLAYYHYWWAYVSIQGPTASMLVTHLTEHAEEEKKHIEMLAERIRQLGGYPIYDIGLLKEIAGCKYPEEETDNFAFCILLRQIADSEECAVNSYKNILKHIVDDPVTEKLVQDILAVEEAHLFEMSQELHNSERLCTQ